MSHLESLRKTGNRTTMAYVEIGMLMVLLGENRFFSLIFLHVACRVCRGQERSAALTFLHLFAG